MNRSDLERSPDPHHEKALSDNFSHALLGHVPTPTNNADRLNAIQERIRQLPRPYDPKMLNDPRGGVLARMIGSMHVLCFEIDARNREMIDALERAVTAEESENK